jgi:hypothetical protein
MFWLLAPGNGSGSVGLAVRCPACLCVSINIVSAAHVDVPFYNDAAVGVVDHVFRDDALQTIEAFRAELDSSAFDAAPTRAAVTLRLHSRQGCVGDAEPSITHVRRP